jgi:hypothetical protein
MPYVPWYRELGYVYNRDAHEIHPGHHANGSLGYALPNGRFGCGVPSCSAQGCAVLRTRKQGRGSKVREDLLDRKGQRCSCAHAAEKATAERSEALCEASRPARVWPRSRLWAHRDGAGDRYADRRAEGGARATRADGANRANRADRDSRSESEQSRPPMPTRDLLKEPACFY